MPCLVFASERQHRISAEIQGRGDAPSETLGQSGEAAPRVRTCGRGVAVLRVFGMECSRGGREPVIGSTEVILAFVWQLCCGTFRSNSRIP